MTWISVVLALAAFAVALVLVYLRLRWRARRFAAVERQLDESRQARVRDMRTQAMWLGERLDIEDGLTRLWPRIQVQTPEEGAAVAVLRAVYPSLPVPGAAGDSIGWRTGAPSPEEVAVHSKAAAVHDGGAQWLCTDRTFPGVTVIRLKVLDGRVMLQNGHSFWQALDECRWAPKARFRPVDVEGCAMPRPPATRGGRASVRPTCPKCKASFCVAPGRCDDPGHFFGGIGP